MDRLDRDTAVYDELTVSAAPPAGPLPTRASEFTPERTADATDDELMAALGELHHDPAAQDQILDTLEWRDALDRQRDAELAEHAAGQQREREAALAWESAEADPDHASPLTNPTLRAHRKLNADQACREEYESDLISRYIAAETACRGHLLTPEAQRAGIDPYSLFSGPTARARKWASPELRSWWATHGRITWSEWRYQWHGWESDKAAAQTARAQSLGEVVQ